MPKYSGEGENVEVNARSQIMALIEMSQNAGRGVYSFNELSLKEPQRFNFMRTQLAERAADVRMLKLDDCEIDKSQLRDVVALMHELPELEAISFRRNQLDADGLRVLMEAVKAHPNMHRVDVGNNPLGVSGGEVLRDAITENPKLQVLCATECALGDEGVKLISTAIARNKPGLYAIELDDNAMTEAGARAFAKATLRDNRQLVSVRFEQNDAAIGAILDDTFLRAPSPNMLDLKPAGQDTQPIIHKNDAAIKHAVMLLQEGIENHVPRRLQFFEDRKVALFASPLLKIGTRPPEEVKAEYEAFMEGLPKAPADKQGLPDALFTPDASGFAPLDNPRAWQGQNPLDVLSDVPLTRELLKETTPKGTTLLHSLAPNVGGEELLSYLNAKGVKLGLADLQEAGSTRPSRLMETFIEKGEAAALFRADNLVGASRQDVTAMHAMLPPAQRNEIGLLTVLSGLSRQTGNLGR